MRSTRLIAVLLSVAALSACGGARPSKYYSLDLPGASAGGGPQIETDLLVGRILAPTVLRDNRIVYRVGPTELGLYEYHRWAEMPNAMVENLLLRTLRAGGRFRSVQSMKSNARGEYVIRGRLHELSEISGSALGARVALELELYSQSTGTVLLSRYYAKEEPVNGKEVKAVVESLNRAVQASLGEFSSSLYDYFAKNPPKP